MPNSASTSLREIEAQIPSCQRCPRLVSALRKAHKTHPDYWCKPVPGFGDRRARIVVVGLAPGFHGANQTGKPFQGDAAGTWLYGILEEAGLWNGRSLRNVYIVNAVKCWPPANQPTTDEFRRCQPWLEKELAACQRARVVVALGGSAHRAVLRSWGLAPLTHWPFANGARFTEEGRPTLISSYHPSRQNTNTKRLTKAMWKRTWKSILKEAELTSPW